MTLSTSWALVYDPTVCVPGSPTPTMAPLIAGLETVLAEAAAAAGLERSADVTALWGLVHGLGTLAAAGHFTLDDALVAYRAAVERLLGA